LGLSLVQAVAKLHGSSLQLSDRHPGLQARFTIAADPVAPPAPAADAERGMAAAGRRAMA
jgi:hypothetical protein